MKTFKKEDRRIIYIVLRYFILLLFAMGNLFIFYLIFTPLTVYPVFYLLKLFFSVSLSGITIFLKDYSIHIVKACVAGAAYYLLLILNLTTPMDIKKRLKSIIFSLFLFLIINILRIFSFSVILTKSFSLFNATHLISWYFISSLIIFGVWIITIKTFKIKEIPFYSDFLFLINKIKK